MKLDRPFADPQSVSDLFIGHPLRCQPEDLEFTGGKRMPPWLDWLERLCQVLGFVERLPR